MRYFNRIIIISAIVLFTIICLFSFGDIPFDDSFISYRVALNLKNGFGFNFNQTGEHVEGFSNFLWVILLAIIGVDKKNIVNISIFTGYLLSILTLISVYLKNLTNKKINNLAVLGLIILTDFFAVNTINGLETALFTLLITLTIISVTKTKPNHPADIPNSCVLMCSLFATLTALTRPEGGLFFALIAFALFVSRRKTIKEIILLFILPFTLIYTPYFFGRYLYFGFFLPNTFYARQLILFPTYKQQLISGYFYLYCFFIDQPHMAFLLITSIFAAFKIKKFTYRLYLSGSIIYTAFIFFAGGDWNHMFGTWRFMMPVLILNSLLFKEHLQNISNILLKIIYCSMVIFLSQINFATPKNAPSFIDFEMNKRPKTIPLLWQGFTEQNYINAKLYSLTNNHGHFHLDAKAAIYLKEHYPKTNLLLSQQAGRLAFFSDFTFIDTAGLVSEKIAHMSQKDFLGKKYMDFLASLDADCFVFPVISFTSESLYTDFLLSNNYELNHVFAYSEMMPAFKTHFPKMKLYPAYTPPADIAPYFLYSFRKKRNSSKEKTNKTIPIMFESTWFEIPEENLIIFSEHI